MKRLILIGFSLISLSVFCQSLSNKLIVTTGDSFKNNSIKLDWSMGEILTETYANSEIALTQGFHQETYLMSTENNEVSDINIEINVYPNPTTALVNLQTSGNTYQNLMYRLVDLQGKILLEKSFSASIETINLDNFSSNFYVIEILTKNQKQLKVLKIQKQ